MSSITTNNVVSVFSVTISHSSQISFKITRIIIIQSFSAEIIVIIGNLSLLNSQNTYTKYFKVMVMSTQLRATIRAGSKELLSKDHTNTEQEKGLILTIPYIAGLSESIQRVCRDFDIKTAF